MPLSAVVTVCGLLVGTALRHGLAVGSLSRRDGSYYLVRVLGTENVFGPDFTRSRHLACARRPSLLAAASGRDGHARPDAPPRRRPAPPPRDRVVARDRAELGRDRLVVRSRRDDRRSLAWERPGSSPSARASSPPAHRPRRGASLAAASAGGWRDVPSLRSRRPSSRRQLRDGAPHRRRARRLGGLAGDPLGSSHVERYGCALVAAPVASLGRRRARRTRAPVANPTSLAILSLLRRLARAVALLRRSRRRRDARRRIRAVARRARARVALRLGVRRSGRRPRRSRAAARHRVPGAGRRSSRGIPPRSSSSSWRWISRRRQARSPHGQRADAGHGSLASPFPSCSWSRWSQRTSSRVTELVTQSRCISRPKSIGREGVVRADDVLPDGRRDVLWDWSAPSLSLHRQEPTRLGRPRGP